jgi:hypothetical protein
MTEKSNKMPVWICCKSSTRDSCVRRLIVLLSVKRNWQTTINRLTQESRVDDLQQIHTGILLSSRLLRNASKDAGFRFLTSVSARQG